jgi:prepilin-type N-terminal cleavage/methylation domain-containing protein
MNAPESPEPRSPALRPAARRRAAFSLIELLVSISILSMLIAILAPALSAARRHGQRTTCQTRLREVAGAIWAYSVANDSRIPWVESPMTNGSSSVPGFGRPEVPDAEIDPFNAQKWPWSLQNVLLPLYLGGNRQVFLCPSALRGWPRDGRPLQMTYRDAGVNQPSGVLTEPGDYFRESFGFLDGRPMVELRLRFTGDPIRDAQRLAWSRGTYLRDMVARERDTVRGPHDGGINVLNREFGVEFRDQRTTRADLAPNRAGVLF